MTMRVTAVAVIVLLFSVPAPVALAQDVSSLLAGANCGTLAPPVIDLVDVQAAPFEPLTFMQPGLVTDIPGLHFDASGIGRIISASLLDNSVLPSYTATPGFVTDMPDLTFDASGIGSITSTPLLDKSVLPSYVTTTPGLGTWQFPHPFVARPAPEIVVRDSDVMNAWRAALPDYGRLGRWQWSGEMQAQPDRLDIWRTVAVAAKPGCLQWATIERGRLPDGEEMQMSGGTEPDLAGTLLVEARLNQSFAVAGGATQGGAIDAGCGRLTRSTIDTCFLAGVGIVADRGDGTVGCSGTIVGPRHILTAAHCVCITDSALTFLPGGILVGTNGGFPNAFYKDSPVFGADVRLLDVSGKASALFRIKGVEVANDYCTNREAINDLALITMADDVVYPPELQARLTPPPPVGSPINLAGFGRDPLDVAAGRDEERNIKRYLSATYEGIVDDLLRVQTPLGDSCQGDSGSGAYLRQADGSLAVFGVLSRGDRDCKNTVAATYVDITNSRYAKLLAPLPGFLGMTVAYTPAADADVCVGDRCDGEFGWHPASAVN